MKKELVKVYTPDSGINSPLTLLQEIFHGFGEGKFLGWRLFVRNIRSQYRQSVLGMLWAFVPPLATAMIWIFLRSQSVFSVGDTGIPYPVFVLVGTISWQVFVDSINIPSRTILKSKSMLTKINVPQEAIILASIYEIMFNFVIKIILLIVVLFWFRFMPALTFFLCFFSLGAIVIFGMSISLILSPISLLYGDVNRAVQLVTQFLFFLTPVIYPEPKAGTAKLVIELNPMSHLITATRNWLTVGFEFDSTSFWIVASCSLILFMFGLGLFKLALPHLVERMGS